MIQALFVIRKSKVWLMIVMSLCYFSLSAQWNLRIGYSTAFPQYPQINDFLNSYDGGGLEVVESFGDVSFMHGIQLGVRYKIKKHAFILGWEKLSSNQSSLALNRTSEQFISREYQFDASSIFIGSEQYLGRMGYGADISCTRLSIDRNIGNNQLSLVNERQFQLKFKLMWILQQTDYLSFMIQPFYQFSLAKYDISGFSNDISIGSTSAVENPAIWGISFIFNNGRQ